MLSGACASTSLSSSSHPIPDLAGRIQVVDKFPKTARFIPNSLPGTRTFPHLSRLTNTDRPWACAVHKGRSTTLFFNESRHSYVHSSEKKQSTWNRTELKENKVYGYGLWLQVYNRAREERRDNLAGGGSVCNGPHNSPSHAAPYNSGDDLVIRSENRRGILVEDPFIPLLPQLPPN